VTQPEPVMYCARHPHTETVITCGRCGVAICPQCMVFTPGGIRCPDCALLRRPVMYTLAPLDYLRAIAAAAIVAVPLAYVGSFLLPPSRNAAILMLAIALLAGIGAGAAVGEAMSWATKRKRGREMQVIAVAAVVLAAVLRLLFAGVDLSLWAQDIVGNFAAVVAAVSAWGRLR
jgi:hypothetical protein